MEERTLSIENRLRARVEQMLSNVLGPGRARVQVSAEIDLNRSTRTLETFDPDSQVVRSTQIRELKNEANGPGQQGAVSVANELPGTSGTGNGTGGSSEQSNTTEEVTNFEISKTTQTEVNEAGSIKRLSVAVVVDGKYTQDANGAATYESRTDAEMDQINALVRSAVGFVAERGDQVEIANMQFAERPELTNVGTEAPGLLDFTRDDLMNAAEMAVTLLISLALLFFVVRPLVKRMLEPESEPLALPTSSEVPEGATAPLAEGGVAAPVAPDWMDNAKLQGEAHMETLKEVGGVVDENPKQAALIVRDWLNQAA